MFRDGLDSEECALDNEECSRSLQPVPRIERISANRNHYYAKNSSCMNRSSTFFHLSKDLTNRTSPALKYHHGAPLRLMKQTKNHRPSKHQRRHCHHHDLPPTPLPIQKPPHQSNKYTQTQPHIVQNNLLLSKPNPHDCPPIKQHPPSNLCHPPKCAATQTTLKPKNPSSPSQKKT